MSYTPPASNAVNFEWPSAEVYSPTPGLANFGWGQGYASGIDATARFGQATNARTQPAEGLDATARFGNPGNYPSWEDATGFTSIEFGTGIVAFNQLSFTSTAFGAVDSFQTETTRDPLILDIATGAPIMAGFAQVVSATPYANPFAAFSEWAAEMSVSNITMPGNVTGDDQVSVVDMGFQVLRNNDADTHLLISSEGGFGLYRESPVDTSPRPSSGWINLPGEPGVETLSYFRGTMDMPSLVIGVKRLFQDVEAIETRWRRNEQTVIAYGKYGTDGTLDAQAELALRLTPGRIEAVVLAGGTGTYSPYFYVLPVDQVDLSPPYAGVGGRSTVLTVGQTHHFVAEGDVPVWVFAQGEHPLATFGRPTIPGAVDYVKDLATGSQALGRINEVSISPYANAAAAYLAWATQLGVSPTASLPGAPGDPTPESTVIDLGFAPLEGGVETRIAWTDQFGIAMYRAALADATIGFRFFTHPDGQVGGNRTDLTVSTPSLFVSAMSEFQDHKIANAKWQKLGDVAILYADYVRTGDSTTVNAAFRLQPGALEFVTTNTTVGGFPIIAAEVICYPQDDTTAGYSATGYDVANTGGFTAYLNTGDTPGVRHFVSLVPLVTVTASGFTSTNFGTPFSPLPAVVQASGWLSENFGEPHFRVKVQVTGFMSETFGTPRLATICQASGEAAATAFGQASIQYQARGFSVSDVGRPFAYQSGPDSPHQYVRANGENHTAFGTPINNSAVVAAQTGSTATHVGQPTSGQGLAAAGWQEEQFGAPAVQTGQAAAGWVSEVFGLAHAGLVLPAVGEAPRTHFGTPESAILGTHLVRGWQATRFGAPTAILVRPYQARSIDSRADFGHPTVLARAYLVRTLDARARFGRPRAEREVFGQDASGLDASPIFGLPTTHFVVHPRHIAPGTQFGLASIARSILC